jgi:anti-anti-sigma regulatory factor
MAWRVLSQIRTRAGETEKLMLRIHVEKIGDVAVVECEGRVVQSDAEFRLRNAVTSLSDVRIIVIDLSEVRVIEGGGRGMLTFLGQWAKDNEIQFKLFNPTKSVRDTLEAAKSMPAFDFATLHEMMALLEHADTRYVQAA